MAYHWFFYQLLADASSGVRTENPYEANVFLIPAQTYGETNHNLEKGSPFDTSDHF